MSSLVSTVYKCKHPTWNSFRQREPLTCCPETEAVFISKGNVAVSVKCPVGKLGFPGHLESG